MSVATSSKSFGSSRSTELSDVAIDHYLFPFLQHSPSNTFHPFRHSSSLSSYHHQRLHRLPSRSKTQPNLLSKHNQQHRNQSQCNLAFHHPRTPHSCKSTHVTVERKLTAHIVATLTCFGFMVGGILAIGRKEADSV